MSVDEKLLSDGTLHITVGTDLSKVKRVFLSQEGTHFGDLYYADAEPEIIRCGQCKYAEVADPEDSQDGYTCQFHRGSIWFSGSYCSWAERREG